MAREITAAILRNTSLFSIVALERLPLKEATLHGGAAGVSAREKRPARVSENRRHARADKKRKMQGRVTFEQRV